MNEREEILKRMRAAAFIQNNGQILRILNIASPKFESLVNVLYAARNMDEWQLIESVNYLAEKGYIHLRDIQSKKKADIADIDYKDIEAKLSAAGTGLLRGAATDDLVEP